MPPGLQKDSLNEIIWVHLSKLLNAREKHNPAFHNATLLWWKRVNQRVNEFVGGSGRVEACDMASLRERAGRFVNYCVILIKTHLSEEERLVMDEAAWAALASTIHTHTDGVWMAQCDDKHTCGTFSLVSKHCTSPYRNTHTHTHPSADDEVDVSGVIDGEGHEVSV